MNTLLHGSFDLTHGTYPYLFQVESSPGKTRRSKTEEDMVAGVELLAQAIDSVIMRVQVQFLKTGGLKLRKL